MGNKHIQPKRVKFDTKYIVKKQIDFAKTIPEMMIWTDIVHKTEDRKVWEAFMPRDKTIEVGTVITFTRWVLDGNNGLSLHQEHELKNEDFLVFQIDGSDVEYATNLKDVDEFEEVK